ncbi:PssD/Cps14F family polysaccharide biosynthesis glycosyltransferase [Butyrivibrio sp. JL13D10]|uniref:PssD/Cps14F family polysaccharide biosynthesis glycosyltransferase n=1 Tax=Butyrivibrio sp. JL13D10 TaxID=3236815 RepID=UPI0038B6855C
MKKVLMVASSGGHMEELTRLKKVISKYDCCWVTEFNDFQTYGENYDVNYYVMQVNRKEFFFPIKFLILFVRAWYIILREKPDCVISTGALISYPFCRIAKWMGKKVIFIESFARVNELSLTGRLLYNHVNRFIVQWPELSREYDKAVVGGGIF